MNKQEYMAQLKKKLKRLPKEDFSRAVEYFEEYFADAGAENEAEAMRDLGAPQEAADQIIREIAFDYSQEPVTSVTKGLRGLWTAFLALCAAPIALPLLFAGFVVIASAVVSVFAVLLALWLAAVCIAVSGPIMAAAGFTVLAKSFPVFITCIGMGCASTGIGMALAYGMYLLCRRFLSWIIRGFIKVIRKGELNNA